MRKENMMETNKEIPEYCDQCSRFNHCWSKETSPNQKCEIAMENEIKAAHEDELNVEKGNIDQSIDLDVTYYKSDIEYYAAMNNISYNDALTHFKQMHGGKVTVI